MRLLLREMDTKVKERPNLRVLENSTNRLMRWDLCAVLALAIVVRFLVAWPMQRPGYMDAAYYIDGALSLYEGHGFVDPFVWNYLDDPTSIPHPSHLYWMPLSSVLAYVSFVLLGPTYRAAQVPFALLSALLPLLAYWVAHDLTQRRLDAMCAALFAILSGFYSAYWVTPDNFAPFALFGGCCLWAAGRGMKTGKAMWFALAGLAAGLAHLSRADGLLLPAAVLLLGLWDTFTYLARGPRGGGRLAKLTSNYGLLVFCYLVVMSSWLIRNMLAIGRPLSTAGAQTMWLTDYDDLYSYGKPLTLASYLAWGWGNIARSKLQAIWLNAQTVLFVGWMIFLAPFGVFGVWLLRERVELRPAWAYGALLFGAMSLAFTYPGWRGGMLHSLTALLPALYAAAMAGLDAFVRAMAKWRRSWQLDQARRVFAVGFVVIAAVLSTVLYITGLPKFRGRHPYQEVAGWMRVQVSSEARVMVNDPASFYYHSRRECLAIPNADLGTVLEVMGRYDAPYLLLDGNNPSLRGLYESPQDESRLELVHQFGGAEEPIYLLELSDVP